MTTVTIRLVLTLTSLNAMPIRIDRIVPIKLGVHADGTPIRQSFFSHGIANEGELELDLVLPPNASFEFPSLPLTGGITHVYVDGKTKTGEICERPQPMSQAYKQLTLLAGEYTSGN